MDNNEKDEYIKKLEIENIALKEKLKSVYKRWDYDYARFTELKNIYKKGNSLKF